MEKLDFLNNNKVLTVLGGGIILLIILNSYISNQSHTIDEVQTEDMTTYIPKGFRLVPIKIENYKSLDQILGNYGTVDVYFQDISSTPKKITKLLASNVRAIRSQNDPSSIGLLVPKSEVKSLLTHSGPFTLTINNSDNSETIFENSQPKMKKMRIYYSQ